MNEKTFLSVFEGVPVFDIKKEMISAGVSVTELLVVHTQVFTSKGELRRLVQGGGLSINRVKIENPDETIGLNKLLNGKYLLIQKGRKNYSLVRVI
jgi:tyrosyl-tRNA synthetase